MTDQTRTDLLARIAQTVADYRQGEIAAPTPAHVDTWINQFDQAVQEPMLTELAHVLNRTYLTKTKVETFISKLLKNDNLAGSTPCNFWKTIEFLKIQGGGNSQSEMLEMFTVALMKECGFGVSDCGKDPQAYLYLDDAIFTGNRVRNDLTSWIKNDSPQSAHVHVVVIGLHRGGQYYAKDKIARSAIAAGKTITPQWWRCLEIEDRKAYTDSSDVLRPTSVPADILTQAYVEGLKYPPVLRKPGHMGGNKFFSSEEGRHLLEQEFLKAGARIRSICPYLNDYQRPLGNMVLETLGFGSLIVTFRNCPNNTPLALWAGDPWYPLFPRKTN